MPTSGNVPQHLVVMARTGFLTSVQSAPMPWQQIASTINMGAKSIDLVDLGAAPMPSEAIGGGPAKDFIEKSLTIASRPWELKVWISYNAVKDDQTETLETKVRNAGSNFQRHINQRVFSRLNSGDVATSLGYDGLPFFSAVHIDPGAAYQTAQANSGFALALSLDNFETVYVACQNFLDDQGIQTDYVYNTLVIPPAYSRIAAQICGNATAYDTANREANPYSGMVSPLVSNQLDAAAWILLATGQAHKPMIVALREQPNLQDHWFDPNAADGGRYYFKFYARYDVYWGDWRLAALGHT